MKHTPDKDCAAEAEPGKSKSQVKRELAALKELGDRLVALNPADLARLPVSAQLVAAVEEARSITSHGAIRRQRQYIGRVMRTEDADGIRAALDSLNRPTREETLRFHDLEEWRERLIAAGDAAFEDFFNQHPRADRQQLRQLVRNARSERAGGGPAGAARKLFRYLRDTVSA